MRYPIVMLTLLVCHWCIPASAAEDTGADTDRLPKIRTIDGTTLDESVTSGKVVVLEFWATWCPSCVEQMPHLKKLYEQYRERGVVFVGVSEDSDPAVVRRFVDKHEIPWHIAVDEDHAVAKQFKIKTLPGVILFGRDGVAVWRGLPRDLDKALRDAVEAGE
jgi:thiol-disulfide isomerase/thioredoxin